MGTCACNSEKETAYICQKYNVYLCDECLGCRDPELYCKYRQSCAVWFLHKEKQRALRQEKSDS